MRATPARRLLRPELTEGSDRKGSELRLLAPSLVQHLLLDDAQQRVVGRELLGPRRVDGRGRFVPHCRDVGEQALPGSLGLSLLACLGHGMDQRAVDQELVVPVEELKEFSDK